MVVERSKRGTRIEGAGGVRLAMMEPPRRTAATGACISRRKISRHLASLLLRFGWSDGGDGMRPVRGERAHERARSMELSDLPDGVLAVVLDHVARGPDGISDVSRASCVNRYFRAMALDRQRRMRTLDVRSLGRRARHAVPHIARRCTSLRRVFCDRTNITDECVTALLTASALTLERLSLADCRHLRDLHGAWERADDKSPESPESPRWFGRLRELDISGSSWSPRALVALLRGARDSLTALNLASTHVSRGSVGHGDDFGEVAGAVLGCARLRRLNLGQPVDFVVPCLALKVFAPQNGPAADAPAANGARRPTPDGVFAALEELSFQRNAAVNDDVLARIAAECMNITRLDLRGTTVSREGIAAFATRSPCAPRLRSLLLGGCDSLDDAALAAVASRCGALLELDLSMHTLVGVGGIEALAEGCRALRRLRISRNAKVTAEALGRLAAGGALESLSAVRCARAGEEALRRKLGRFAGTCRIDVVGDDFAWTTSRG